MSPIHAIIGAGQAASWAAASMRKQGFAGRILMIGAETYRPYERPPLSKNVLTASPLPAPQYFHDEGKFRQLDIDFVPGVVAEEIDLAAARIRFSGGQAPFDKLLIATGGRARRLDIPGADLAISLRTYDEACRIRDALARTPRVVCIGAGVIGLEIASSARRLGCAVTVLEAGPAPMGRCVSREGADFIEGLHRSAGVEIRYGVKVVAIEGTDSALSVICADSDSVEGQLVVSAVGLRRNDELAQAAGIATSNGILVDAFGQSSADSVYAAGDVAAFMSPSAGTHLRLESWQHAQNHGAAVGRAICGAGSAYDEIPWFWTDQHGINLQVLGAAAEAARTVVRPADDGSPFTALHLADDDTILGLSAANNPRAIRTAKSLIRQRARIDPALAADPGLPLANIIR